jgi:predicted glycogen debranching enzyme
MQMADEGFHCRQPFSRWPFAIFKEEARAMTSTSHTLGPHAPLIDAAPPLDTQLAAGDDALATLRRVIDWRHADGGPVPLLDREWLVTNGKSGYASGTLSGAATRRYHGLLIAAMPAPLGRLMMFNHLLEYLRLPSFRTVPFGGEERVGGQLEIHGTEHLVEFRLEAGLPVWRYEVDGFVFERRVYMSYRQNTVYINYRLLQGKGSCRLKLRPAVNFRGHDDPIADLPPRNYTLTAVDNHYELACNQTGFPTLKLQLHGQQAAFTLYAQKLPDILYRIEMSRGYEFKGALWSPGHFRVDLAEGTDATLVASTESWETARALTPDAALAAERERRRRLVHAADPNVQRGFGAELVLAADQFVFRPSGRGPDEARARAAGDEVCSVIAGYHWFTDWGRDTMISLEGLTLTTGRHAEAGYILRTFARYIRDGLIPNLFPEGETEGLYHTADATLWFFHAIYRYVQWTRDRETLRLLLPRLVDIVEHHLRGTRFGIGVDPRDGLLRQGAEGYQLTWMDAKVGDWVVTPRRGKAVEINALWYNALRLLEGWLRDEKQAHGAARIGEQAERARRSFNERFWNSAGNYLFDVVDGENGDDASLRPNQVFAISLPHAVLDARYWKPVMETVRANLLTPAGLRSLAPGHPDYKPRYDGDLRSRDAAYHQGTVWAWLIGPYIDAWLRTYPEDRATAHTILEGFSNHLSEACIGSISEVFDAEAPYTPRGCAAQAWSVAEVLRCLARTAESG